MYLIVRPAGSAYLPGGETYRVMVVPHTRTSGWVFRLGYVTNKNTFSLKLPCIAYFSVLRLLSSPLHIQGQNKHPMRDEAYDMVGGRA